VLTNSAVMVDGWCVAAMIRQWKVLVDINKQVPFLFLLSIVLAWKVNLYLHTWELWNSNGKKCIVLMI
jgi:hypothetical protein